MSTPKRGKTADLESTERSPKNFRWSQAYKDTLVELLVREARNGNRPDSTFTATAFRNVVTDFNMLHGTCILKKHVQSRIKTMKQHFALFHAAFNGLSGFSWNEESNKFEAEDTLWEERIKDNSKFEKFRNKSCHNWDKLFKLYGGTRATGCAASGLKDKSTSIQRGLQFQELHIQSPKTSFAKDEPEHCSSIGDHDFFKADEVLVTTPDYMSSQQSGRTGGSSLKRKASILSVVEDGYKTMAASIDKLSMAMVDTSEKVAVSKFDVSQNCQIYDALYALDLDENYMVRCYCYLCAHPSKAAIIVAAPTTIRPRLLADIMKGAGSAN